MMISEHASSERSVCFMVGDRKLAVEGVGRVWRRSRSWSSSFSLSRQPEG
jgi:hypothetical protein